MQRFNAESDPVFSILISVVDPDPVDPHSKGSLDPVSQSRSRSRRAIMTLGQNKCFIPVYGTRNLIKKCSFAEGFSCSFDFFLKKKKKFQLY
jgi:hypothetical protein